MKKTLHKKIQILFLIYKKYCIYNLFSSLISFLSLVALYGAPLLNAVIIDNAIGKGNVKLLFISVLGYCLLHVLNGLFSYLLSIIHLKYQYNIECYIKNKLLLFYLKCSRLNLKGVTSAEIITVIRDDANIFIQLVSNNIQDIIIAVIKILVAGFLMIKLQFVLGISVLIIQILMVLFKKLYNQKLAKNSVKVRENHISVIQKLNEISCYITDIPMIRADKYLVKGYNKAFRDSYLVCRENNKISQGTLFLSNLFDILSTCIILLLGGFFVIHGEITIGVLISFISYSAMLTSPIYELCDLPTQYNADKESIDTVFNILTSCESVETNDEHDIDKVNINKVSINDIRFGYDEGNIIFVGANAIFSKDKLNYIVGKSGIGKSTLLKLILGYYPLQKGKIYFDDKDIVEIVEAGKMQHYISWVPQEPIIFHDTIRNNITLCENIPEDKLIEACKKCAILDDIYGLNSGFETLVDEAGNNLSVGQKHRLGLARALLQEQPIVLIDEATAGIDLLTEQIIKQNLQNSFEGKIVIVVTHSPDFIVKDACVFEIIDKKIVKRESA